MTKYVNQVKVAGRRLTKARQAVLQYLQSQQEPQTVSKIFHGLKESHIDLASVYRTVVMLEQLGLALREQQGNIAAYALADHHHHHIICRSCAREACLPCAINVPQPKGFIAIQHEVRLTGVCANCARA